MIKQQLLRMTEITKLLGLSKSTIYRLIQAGRFPKPVSMTGAKAVAWRMTEIELWISTLPRAEIAKDE
jgi:prophage regulatory protein